MNTREFTEDEKAQLARGQCPFCGSSDMLAGPWGGLARNWRCANEKCQAGFNIATSLGVFWYAELIREPIASA